MTLNRSTKYTFIKNTLTGAVVKITNKEFANIKKWLKNNNLIEPHCSNALQGDNGISTNYQQVTIHSTTDGLLFF